MKGLTLTQPHAQLIAIAATYPDLGKHIETRNWATAYRGPLAIHAAKGLGPVGGKKGLRDTLRGELFYRALQPHLYPQRIAGHRAIDVIADALPRGAIVAVCELVDCMPIIGIETAFGSEEHTWHLTDQERAFGDYSPGRYVWLLANIRALPEPVPCKGQLGLWDLDAVTRAAVEGQL